MAPVPLGIMGKFYSVRHAQGTYRSASVTGAYSISPPSGHPAKDWIHAALERSLQATIRQHPGLAYGLASEAGEDSIIGYEAINTIDRDDVVDFIQIDDSQDLDSAVCRELEQALSRLWPPLKPAWRIIVLHGELSVAPAPSNICVIFFAHHALADGRSNAAFHLSLMDQFAEASKIPEPPIWPMVFDKAPPPPPQVEDLIKIPAPVANAVPAIQEALWAGTKGPLPSLGNFRSRIRLVTIPSGDLSRALGTCKENKVTLTGYLYGVICASLCNLVEEECGLRSIIPFSVRDFTKADPKAILDHVSFMVGHASKTKLEGIRKSQPHSAQEFSHIINLAREIRIDIEKELQRYPQESPLAHNAQVKDIWAHCQGQLEQRSQLSFELSNLGAISAGAEAIGNLSLERLIFGQCGMHNGPAIGFGAVSVRGGPLTISITWEAGVVEDDQVEFLATDLEKRLGKSASV